MFEGEGVRLRLLIGRAMAKQLRRASFLRTFYADVQLAPNARIPLPDDREDRGVYILDGSISVSGQSFESRRMAMFRPKDRIAVVGGDNGARLILLGGAPLEGPRFIWWNFVASSQERIDSAKEEWRKGDWGRGLFDLPPDDREEFIPLPT